MTIKSIKGALLFSSLLWAINAGAADIDWQGWSFDYSTNSNSSGLVITDVDFNGRRILDKVSMPVMRVEYDNDICGPYADIMSSSRLSVAQGAPDSACDNQSVCTRTFTQNGEDMLEVGGNWQIGEYQIYQTYYFSANGYIDSRVYSRGLQCRVNHRHHAHWMFDFDIGDSANDRIMSGGDIPQSVEFNDLTSDTAFWTIEDTVSGDSVRLIPSSDDGAPDNFSKWDAAGRLYNAAEVGRWRLGARGEIGANYMQPPQNIDGEDIVMWYVSHLPHASSEGSGVWHASGPRVEVVSADPPTDPDPDPDPDLDPDPGTDPDNLLVNGGFDATTLTGWNDCASADNTELVTTTPHQGDQALSVSGGGCLYQEVAANAGQQYSLSCQAKRSGSLWTIMEFGFLDASYNSLASQVRQVGAGDYSSYSATATAPEGTEYAMALLYSEDQTQFDTCLMVAGEIENPDPDTDTDQGTNLIANGDFESALANWNTCSAPGLSTVVADADGGTAALSVRDGGCMYQEFNINAGNSYSMNCRAKRNSATAYTSVTLSLMNASYSSLQTTELPVTTAAFGDYSTTLTAPGDSVFGSVVVYSEDPAVFDNCTVTAD